MQQTSTGQGGPGSQISGSGAINGQQSGPASSTQSDLQTKSTPPLGSQGTIPVPGALVGHNAQPLVGPGPGHGMSGVPLGPGIPHQQIQFRNILPSYVSINFNL